MKMMEWNTFYRFKYPKLSRTSKILKENVATKLEQTAFSKPLTPIFSNKNEDKSNDPN
jgi:hypothetical protein